MKLSIAVFNCEDELITKQDIMELNNTQYEIKDSFLNEVASATKQDFLNTLTVDDFKRLLERVP